MRLHFLALALAFAATSRLALASRALVALALPVILVSATPIVAFADELTPSSNLAGIKKVHEKISVALDLKGADEFRIDAEQIKTRVRKELNAAGLTMDGSGTGLPMVKAIVAGEATGGGGARYLVELVVMANMPSPFIRNRSVNAIVWRGVSSGDEAMRYDPTAKGLLSPRDPINERVYASVQEVASRLAADARRANQLK
jgi:hypothetical protein